MKLESILCALKVGGQVPAWAVFCCMLLLIILLIRIAYESILSRIKPSALYTIIDTNIDEKGLKTLIKKTDLIINKNTFAWVPLSINGKHTWLKKVNITKRFYIKRYEEFDDGWNHEFCWGREHYVWVVEDFKVL